jgi:polyphosphate kinase
MFTVEDEDLRDRVVDEILGSALHDNVKARRLLADGTYERVRAEAGAAAVRSQYRFMELAREKAQAGPGIPGAGGGPYQVRTTPPPRGIPAGGSGQAAASAGAASHTG